MVFRYTPRHSSWMNQVEIRFSILPRGVIRPNNFTSAGHLHERVLCFIDYNDRTMARSFQWTYRGKPLVA